MSKKALVVGISCHFIDTKRQNYYFLYTSYCNAIASLGHIPVIIPIIEDETNLDLLMDKFDALIMSGGGPGLTKTFSHYSLKVQNPLRYDYDKKLIELAVAKKIPIMGICRGHQMIAEVLGGQIFNLIEPMIPHKQKGSHIKPSHEIKIESESLLHDALQKETILVNSIHTQAVSVLPDGFKVTARSSDGVIEAFESIGTDPFIICLQFHPEKMFHHTKLFSNIFERFLEKVKD